jgi:hypothetical protein
MLESVPITKVKLKYKNGVEKLSVRDRGKVAERIFLCALSSKEPWNTRQWFVKNKF